MIESERVRATPPGFWLNLLGALLYYDSAVYLGHWLSVLFWCGFKCKLDRLS